MTEFFYGVQEIARRAGRTASSGQQWIRNLPAPEAVLVSNRPASGWKLDTWQQFADTRQTTLREALTSAIDELKTEEIALFRKFR